MSFPIGSIVAGNRLRCSTPRSRTSRVAKLCLTPNARLRRQWRLSCSLACRFYLLSRLWLRIQHLSQSFVKFLFFYAHLCPCSGREKAPLQIDMVQKYQPHFAFFSCIGAMKNRKLKRHDKFLTWRATVPTETVGEDRSDCSLPDPSRLSSPTTL